MTRTEEDSLGAVEVPDDAYYGAFTARARDNFAITGGTPPRELVRALARIKIAAARANRDMDLLDAETADAIVSAAEEVAAGEFDDQFVIDPLQAGAGTPVHMNANEVIANRATELLGGDRGDYDVHPNDDVNMGQSSNNVVPTAFRLAALDRADALLTELEALAGALSDRAAMFDGVVTVGRTHLQDAVPITLGQEFEAYATMIERAHGRISDAADDLRRVGLGGNAIGTGINTPPEFREAVVAELAAVADRDLVAAADPIAATRSMAPFAHLSSTLRTAAAESEQIAHDLMLLASGPVAGLHEITLPEVEPGSSIMPGKVNPSVPEAFAMACVQVEGHDHAVSRATSMGDLELNVMAPVIGHNLLSALDTFASAAAMLRDRCIAGIEADTDRIADLFEDSTAIATALSPYLGYDRTADLVHEALDRGERIDDLVVERGWITADEVNDLLDPARLTGPSGVDGTLRDRVRDRLEDDGDG
ncbi:MAG: aspartate ammonia-lyase [Candidatus Nanohaloarchaea archaeon]